MRLKEYLIENAEVVVDWNEKTEKQQIDMVSEDGMSICKIAHPSEAVQMAAVEQSGYAIHYIENPTEAVQLAAIKQNMWAINHILNPTDAVIKATLTNQHLINKPWVYANIVNKIFNNNALLAKKWIRYGEAMRNQQ